MRVLLDECVPKAIGKALPGHVVRTVVQEGWAGKKNGELLALMSKAGFEILLTVDQGVCHQQNLMAAGISVVIMVASSNDIDELVPLVPEVLAALVVVQPGDFIEVRLIP